MNKKLILLAEDRPDDVDLTLRAFQSNRIANDIAVVHDGEEALEYLFAAGAYADRDPNPLPDLVLLDLKMPKLGGLEVLQAMRADARTRRIPVVILTSSREEDDIANSYDLGANGFVRKPIAFDEFLHVTRQVGMYWLMINEPPPK